jgi:hypothetical protein
MTPAVSPTGLHAGVSRSSNAGVNCDGPDPAARQGSNFNALLNTDEGTSLLHDGTDLSPRKRIYRTGGQSSVGRRSDNRCPRSTTSLPRTVAAS